MGLALGGSMPEPEETQDESHEEEDGEGDIYWIDRYGGLE